MRLRKRIGQLTGGLILQSLAMQAALAQLPAPNQVFSNSYHVTAIDGNNASLPDTQGGALIAVTNGIVEHGSGNGQVDGFDTWQNDIPGVATDFVGLGYGSPATFDLVTIELGNQFIDGGDWEAEPTVYILKNPVMNSDSVRPEISPNWVAVPAAAFTYPEEAEHIFDTTVVPGEGGTVHFLLGGSIEDRTGWGWAVGGVDGNERTSDARFNFISVTELSAEGSPGPAPVIVPPTTPQPMNIVSNTYHSVNHSGVDFLDNSRGEAFESLTNGEVTPGGPDGFDTWENDAVGGSSDFVGLQYNSLVEFSSIQIDLGYQFVDGGDWEEMPKVYVLKNPVDTNQLHPEDDPNWVEVAAEEMTGHEFDPLVIQGDGATMTFQLTGSPQERTGWGWAVGGVDGNENETGRFNFISLTEITATGTVVSDGLTGDFNHNGVLDAGDLDLLAQAHGGGDTSFDLTNDGAVNFEDRLSWVKDLKHTWIGDINLDGEFNSSDFVAAFTAGKYEIGTPATWAEGDWDGDLVFGSSDFVAAFADGGYEQGPRTVFAVAAVPEPAALRLFIAGAAAFAIAMRTPRSARRVAKF